MNRTTEEQIIIRFSSGLGNQLFQLAAGMRLAARTGTAWTADTTWFDLVARIHHPRRHFRLDRFQLPLTEAFPPLRRLPVGLLAAIFDRWGCGHALLEGLGRMRVIQEERPMVPTNFESVTMTPRLYLNGYWQTAEHFLSIRNVLLPCLVPRRELSPGAVALLGKIRDSRTAFVHVRRGDYAILAGSAGLLPAEYYHRAAGMVRDFIGDDVRWLVFAEDADWAEAYMGFLGEWDLVEYASADRDIEDLQLMAACDAAIIANSSYSWWGAALGDRPGRPVITPDRYWNRTEAGTDAWRLPGWHAVVAWTPAG